MHDVLIGVDASGSFPANDGRFESSAVAAATVPCVARTEIEAWANERGPAWGCAEKNELHANELSWSQRREVCKMLGTRTDIHAAVVATNNALLRSEDMVAGHRLRQLSIAETAGARATTDEGRQRAQVAVRLLRGQRVSQARLTDASYVAAVMMPQAVMGAVQRAFCFYAEDEWREEMSGLSLVFDEDRKALMRYVQATFLPVLSDERFRLVTPAAWGQEPVHPLFARARHPDGDGYDLQELMGLITWGTSRDEIAVQVADFAAWVVTRALNNPTERIARGCYELLSPILVGAEGRCFERFSLGRDRPGDDVFFAHLPNRPEPPEWLVPPIVER